MRQKWSGYGLATVGRSNKKRIMTIIVGKVEYGKNKVFYWRKGQRWERHGPTYVRRSKRPMTSIGVKVKYEKAKDSWYCYEVIISA